MRKWMWAGLAAILVVGGTGIYFASKGSSSSAKPLLITATATPRDLRDEVTVQGTLARAEKLTVNSVAAGQVSRVYQDAGTTLTANQSIIGLDGRDAVTAEGAFPFFRKLDVGAEGTDVLQLETILKNAGYSPGTVDQNYTTQTQFALAQWQAAHHYPGAAPQVSQTVNVTLQQSLGYKIGPQSSVGVTIGPPANAKTASLRSGAPAPAVATDVVARAGVSPAVACGCTLTIVPAAAVTPKGTPATFIVSAAPTPSAATICFNVSLSGSGASDAIPPTGSCPFVLPAGLLSTTIQILTRQDNVVEPDHTLTVTLGSSSDYGVGAPSSASTTIVSSAVPQVTLTGTTTVQQGQSATLTVAADQAPKQTTQIGLTVAGNAIPGTDYVAFPPAVTMAAGQTSATFTITTKTSAVVTGDKQIVVALTPSATAYRVGPVSTATVTIAGTSGSAATPVLTIRASGLRVEEGQPAQFVVSLDRQLSDPLQFSLTFGGNAVAGTNYSPPGSLLVVPAGMTSLQVVVPTLDDGVVAPDKALFVGIAPSANYTVGDPSLAGSLIVDQDLPEIQISGGPASVSKGGGAVFTITSDQPPVEDTSVQYLVTGSAKPGVDVQATTGTALLPAGQTSVTVPILTLNTDVFFLPTDMIAGAWPTRLGEVFVKEGDVVIAGAPLFSLTETALTVTLNASAADRTKLKVGQAATVQLQGGDGSTAPGIITQLDDTPTTDKATQKQTYEGKVQVQGTLGAADGAPVTIKVVLKERLGALTVPIAAVKQNGQGQDVVRVIDLVHGGQVREVRVKTGLSEGSYIEIESGLTNKQVVVVEIDQKSGG